MMNNHIKKSRVLMRTASIGLAFVPGLLIGKPGGPSTTTAFTPTTQTGSDYALTNFTTNLDDAYALVQQTDGKLVAAGVINDTLRNESAVVIRYNSDLTPDTSFGSSGGALQIPLGSAQNNTVKAMVMDAQGRFVLAGSTSDPYGHPVSYYNNVLLARVTASGALDSSFGSGGVVHSDLSPGQPDVASAVALDSSGNIVVGGSANNSSGVEQFAVARYTPSGRLDTTFNGTGKNLTLIPGGAAKINAIAIQSDGKIVAVGRCAGMNNNAICLARYNSNGTLDATLTGGNGTSSPLPGVVEVTHSTLAANGLVIDPAGNYAIVGDMDSSSGAVQTMAGRFLGTTGALDTTFGGTGLVSLDVSTNPGTGVHSAGYAIQYEQATGDYVLAAQSGGYPDVYMAAAKVTSAGTFDIGYHTVGYSLFRVTGSTTSLVAALVVAPTGVYVCGSSNAPTGSGSDYQFTTMFEAN